MGRWLLLLAVVAPAWAGEPCAVIRPPLAPGAPRRVEVIQDGAVIARGEIRPPLARGLPARVELRPSLEAVYRSNLEAWQTRQ